MDNKYELVFNERDDAAELKNLPIDDTMHGIIEEEELEDEASDEENEADWELLWPSMCHSPISKACVCFVSWLLQCSHK